MDQSLQNSRPSYIHHVAEACKMAVALLLPHLYNLVQSYPHYPVAKVDNLLYILHFELLIKIASHRRLRRCTSYK
jgi:hypothetical protein